MIHHLDEHQLVDWQARFQLILDARSPAEYATDHLPGARNVPVLSDSQRVEIGILDRQDPFAARKRGVCYALENLREFFGSPLLQDLPKQTNILVYCARGGQRSGALATVLSQTGFTVWRLQRGYKTYRAMVLNQLARPLPQPVFVLHGYTGSQKTRLLLSLAEEANVLDLEGCANHRGSLLGLVPGNRQPTQKEFETRVWQAINGFGGTKPTLIEGESRAIGKNQVPNPVWVQMVAGHHLWLDLPRAERVRFILEDYADLKDATYLEDRLTRLARYLPKKVIGELGAMAAEGDWRNFVTLLLETHYDPLYRKNLKRGGFEVFRCTNFQEARAYLENRLREPFDR